MPGWVDLAIVLGLLTSVFIGLWRGFVYEVLSLVGWVAAFVIAQVYGDDIAMHLPIGNPGDRMNHAAGIALTFIGALMIWGLISKLIRMLLHLTPLGQVDRAFGAAFGAMRGMLLLIVVAIVMAMLPWGRSKAWQQSIIGPWAMERVQDLKPMLPPEVVRHLPLSVGHKP
jgi:membrane protein required for colicin V production